MEAISNSNIGNLRSKAAEPSPRPACKPSRSSLLTALHVVLFIALATGAMAQYSYAVYVFPRNTIAGAKPLFSQIVQRYPNIDIELDASNTFLQLYSNVPVIEQDIIDAADAADFGMFFFSPGVWGMVPDNPDPQAMTFPGGGAGGQDIDPLDQAQAKEAWIQENPEAYERLKRAGAKVLPPSK